MCTWFQEMRDACDKLDRPATLGASLKEIFERVGFVDVEQLVFRLPLNAWPRDERLKDLGWMWGQNFSQGLNGFSTLLMNRAYGRTQDEIEVCRLGIPSLHHCYTNLLSYPAITRQSQRRNSRPTCACLYAHFRGVWKKAVYWRDGRVKAATNTDMQKKKGKRCLYMCIFCIVEGAHFPAPMS